MIRIVTVGKKHDALINQAILSYQKRLHAPFDVQWGFVPHSLKNGDLARQDESERILKRLSDDAFVVLLDERGQQMTSQEFSNEISTRDATIIIGGAYGVNEALRQRANIVLSLSKMVLPHQLVRLVLIEQIYRGQCIASDHPYHHI